MEITKVKQMGSSYLVNDKFFVPSDLNNSDYKDVIRWIQNDGEVEPELSLDELKDNKKSQLKLNRDAANLRLMTSIQADEITYIDGEEIRTSTKKYFAFSVAETGQPATSPSSIIFSTILASLANPSYFLRYSCFIIEGEETRKGYVAIDSSVASTILSHIAYRATTNIAHANEIEALITAATSEEELEEINIEF